MFIEFRELEPEDEAGMLRMFGARSDYFVAATGLPPGDGDVQSLFYSLPEGASAEQKTLLAIVSDGVLVGVLDAVLDHPRPGTASLGVFMTDPDSPVKGLGMPIAALATERAIALGIGTVFATCPSGWAPGEALLRSFGFVPVDGELSAQNRTIPTGESSVDIRRWVAHLMSPPPLPF